MDARRSESGAWARLLQILDITAVPLTRYGPQDGAPSSCLGMRPGGGRSRVHREVADIRSLLRRAAAPLGITEKAAPYQDAAFHA